MRHTGVKHPLLHVLLWALVLMLAVSPAAIASEPVSDPASEPALVSPAAVEDGRAGDASTSGGAAGLSPGSATRSGVDYVKKNVDWAVFFRELKATGRDFIGRYLPIQGAMQRCVTTTELAAAAAAGIDCFFWFETMDDLYRAGRGYAAGVADAREALRALASLGVPTTTPVYYTVDWDNSDGSQIDAYFKGIASVVPLSQIGAYGNYTTVEWLSQRSMATYYCQSDFWMDARGWHPQAHMHQQTATFRIGGVWVDRLTVTTARFGQNSRYEQTDPRLLYTGAWSTGTLPTGSYSGGSHQYSASPGASVTLAFNGTSLDWIAKRGPAPGTATVTVDGEISSTVDLYAGSTVYKQKVWGTGPLPDGLHTVTIDRTAGTLNLDAFDVSGALVATTRAEETSDALLYGGAWAGYYSPSASGSYLNLSNEPGASVTVHFTGQRLDVRAATGPTMGMADISLDGRPATTVDLYHAVASSKQKVWSTGEQPAGHHVVTIARGAASPAGSYLNLDALDIVGLAATPPVISGLAPDWGSTAGDRTTVVSGAGFVGLAGPGAVTFGGTDAVAYTVASSTKITAVAPPQATGVVQVQVNAAGGSTDDTADDDYTYLPPVTYVSLRGSDRYDTALKVAQAMFPGPLPAGSGLVLAPGETFPEALCASPLAAAYRGPVLLTPTVGLNNGVRDEMLRLAPTHVVCVGLPDLVVEQVRAALGEGVMVTSITGTAGSVYDLSYKVAKALVEKVGDMSAATGLVTMGANFPDAIAVSPLACARLWPVILTDKAGGALHASAAATLADLGITRALKVGTYAVLPVAVTGLANLSGADRYLTNANVAEWAEANAGLTFAHTALVTGDKFPDALACGPYLSKDQGILLLTPLNGPLPAPVSALMTAHAAGIYRFSLIAMIEPVTSQVKALLP